MYRGWGLLPAGAFAPYGSGGSIGMSSVLRGGSGSTRPGSLGAVRGSADEGAFGPLGAIVGASVAGGCPGILTGAAVVAGADSFAGETGTAVGASRGGATYGAAGAVPGTMRTA